MNADDTPDPARLAAIDQQLAAMDSRLDRTSRAIMRGDLAAAAVAVLLIAVEVAARPPLYRWEIVTALTAVALAAVSGFLQGILIRGYRAEIRELRSRAR